MSIDTVRAPLRIQLESSSFKQARLLKYSESLTSLVKKALEPSVVDEKFFEKRLAALGLGYREERKDQDNYDNTTVLSYQLSRFLVDLLNSSLSSVVFIPSTFCWEFTFQVIPIESKEINFGQFDLAVLQNYFKLFNVNVQIMSSQILRVDRPLLFAFLELLSQCINVLVMRIFDFHFHIPQRMPRLHRLEIFGGRILPEEIKAIQAYALREFIIENSILHEGTFKTILKKFPQLHRLLCVDIRGSFGINEIALLSSTSIREIYISLPSIDRQDISSLTKNVRVELAFAIWRNLYKRELSEETATKLIKQLPLEQEDYPTLLKRSLKRGFTPFLNELIYRWNRTERHVLQLSLEGALLTGHLKGFISHQVDSPFPGLLELLNHLIIDLPNCGIKETIKFATYACSLELRGYMLEPLDGINFSPFLKTLTLRNVKNLAPETFKSLAAASNGVSELIMVNCTFSNPNAILDSLCHSFPVLTALSLDSCHQVNDSWISLLAKHHTALTSLNLSRSSITKNSFKPERFNFPKLERLSLEDCPSVCDDVVAFLSKIHSKLSFLHLDRTQVTRKCLKEDLFSRLKELSLEGIPIGNEGLQVLTSKDLHLTQLNVSGCNISGNSLVRAALRMPVIQHLYCSKNPQLNIETLFQLASQASLLKHVDLSDLINPPLSLLIHFFKECPMLETLRMTYPNLFIVECIARPPSPTWEIPCVPLTDEELYLLALHQRKARVVSIECPGITCSGLEKALFDSLPLSFAKLSFCLPISVKELIDLLKKRRPHISHLVIKGSFRTITSAYIGSLIQDCPKIDILELHHKDEYEWNLAYTDLQKIVACSQITNLKVIGASQRLYSDHLSNPPPAHSRLTILNEMKE